MAVRRRGFLKKSAGLSCLLLTGLSRWPESGNVMAGRELPLPRDLKIRFHFRKILSLHTYLRVLASRNATPAPQWATAVEVYRTHMAEVPDPRIWITMESLIAPATDLESLAGQIILFPLQYRGEFNLAPMAQGIATAIKKTLPTFEASLWPQLQTRKQAATDPALRHFQSKREDLVQYIFTSLNAERLPLLRLDFDLVGQYLLTGSDTRKINGKYFTIIETNRFSKTAMIETIVMMLARIVELEDRANSKGALFMLRKQQEGLHLPNPSLLPRAVLYWTAAAAVRDVVDPSHEAVGETLRIYERALRRYMPAVKENWEPYLQGKLGLEESITRIVRQVGEEA